MLPPPPLRSSTASASKNGGAYENDQASKESPARVPAGASDRTHSLPPLITVFAKAVITDGRLDLYRAWQTIASRENVQTICNSLLLGVCVVLCSTVIAVPTACLLARTQLAKHSWLEIVFMIPFMTPPYIASMGWVLFMQKRACFSSCFPQQVRGQRASSASAGLCW